MKKLPKYLEIVNSIKTRIENNEIEVGEMIPTENEICNNFSCSHMTVNKAMNELNALGYIKRIPSKGTFASDKYKTSIKKSLISRESVTSQIIKAGMTPRIELYKYNSLKGKDVPIVSKELNIKDDEYLHYFIRVRYADDNLMCISCTYLSQKIIPALDIKRLEGSLNEYIEELKIERTSGSIEFCAVLPDEELAKIIGSKNVPLLKQTIHWDSKDGPFELTYHYFVGSKYSITSDLQILHNEKVLV